MDIQSYIASGKLELFVLGELSEREEAEVLEMAARYPEIREELNQIEDAFFQLDNQTGKAPSAGLKSKVMATWEKEVLGTAEQAETKIIPMQPWKTYFVAASIAAVFASAVAVYFASQYFSLDQRFMALLDEKAVLVEDLNQYKVNYEQTETQLDVLLTGNFTKIPMKGEPFEIQKEAKVDVWWDQSAAKVFVSVNQLASLSEDLDYQLWAIGDGGPVGIGLVNPGQSYSLQQMESVLAAGAFAITIEPKGGSASPTLEKLVVIGNVG